MHIAGYIFCETDEAPSNPFPPPSDLNPTLTFTHLNHADEYKTDRTHTKNKMLKGIVFQP